MMHLLLLLLLPLTPAVITAFVGPCMHQHGASHPELQGIPGKVEDCYVLSIK
jgi:hypothetical protein